MSRTHDHFHLSVKLLLENAEGKFLILHAKPGDMTGPYDVPGGRTEIADRGLSLIEILQREVAEELGSIAYTVEPMVVGVGKRIVPAAVHPSGQDTPMMYVFFRGHFQGGALQLSDEHVGYDWVDLVRIDLTAGFVEGFRDGIQMFVDNHAR